MRKKIKYYAIYVAIIIIIIVIMPVGVTGNELESWVLELIQKPNAITLVVNSVVTIAIVVIVAMILRLFK